MPAERLGNVLRRGWLFLALVAVATLVGSLIADAARPDSQPARMEVLVAARMTGGGQYDVEVSRATASDFIVDDLGRIVRGTEFAALVAGRYFRNGGAEIAPGEVAAALATDRTHRGLELRMTTTVAAKSVDLARAAADVLADEIDVLYPTIYEVATLSLIDLAPVSGKWQRSCARRGHPGNRGNCDRGRAGCALGRQPAAVVRGRRGGDIGPAGAGPV